MKQSLKNQILAEVRRLGYCPLDRIHKIAAQGGYKQSTSEKKCRELAEAGKIKPVYNERGYLIAYKSVEEIKEPKWWELFKIMPRTADVSWSRLL